MKLPMGNVWCSLAAGIAALGTATAVHAVLSPAPGSGITEANFHRIAEGMTVTEVEHILGCPAGDYTGGRAMNFRCGMGVVGLREPGVAGTPRSHPGVVQGG